MDTCSIVECVFYMFQRLNRSCRTQRQGLMFLGARRRRINDVSFHGSGIRSSSAGILYFSLAFVHVLRTFSGAYRCTRFVFISFAKSFVRDSLIRPNNRIHPPKKKRLPARTERDFSASRRTPPVSSSSPGIVLLTRVALSLNIALLLFHVYTFSTARRRVAPSRETGYYDDGRILL